MQFLVIPFAAALLCQVVKLSLFFYKEQSLSRKALVWEGFWAGKFPSSHAAMLTSATFLVYTYGGNTSLTVFAAVISILILYSLLEDKKRHLLIEEYVARSADTALARMVTDGKLREFNGHTFFELMAGAGIGLATSVTLNVLLLA